MKQKHLIKTSDKWNNVIATGHTSTLRTGYYSIQLAEITGLEFRD